MRVKLNLNDLGKCIHLKKDDGLNMSVYCWDAERNTKMYIIWYKMRCLQ